MFFFPFSLNGVRQFVATAIVFYATTFIKEGKYVRFVAVVLAASLLHTSACLGLVYLFFEIVFTKYFEAKRKLAVYLVFLIGVVLGAAAVFALFNRYSTYFDRTAESVGFMMVAKLLMLVMSFLFVAIPLNDKEKYFTFSHRAYYFVGILLNSMSYFILYAGRIGIYFYVFEVIHIGYVIKSKNTTLWTVFFKALYIVILLYYLYNNIANGSQGEIPYRFVWQS